MELTELTAVPVVIALVEIVKRFGVSEKLYPVISLIIGISIAFMLPEPWNPRLSIIKGVLFGLSASGLYSGGKKVLDL